MWIAKQVKLKTKDQKRELEADDELQNAKKEEETKKKIWIKLWNGRWAENYAKSKDENKKRRKNMNQGSVNPGMNHTSGAMDPYLGG